MEGPQTEFVFEWLTNRELIGLLYTAAFIAGISPITMIRPQ